MKQEMRWQWHQLDHTQIICTPLQTAQCFTGHMLFLMPNQQCQGIEGNFTLIYLLNQSAWLWPP